MSVRAQTRARSCFHILELMKSVPKALSSSFHLPPLSFVPTLPESQASGLWKIPLSAEWDWMSPRLRLKLACRGGLALRHWLSLLSLIRGQRALFPVEGCGV